MRKRFLLGKRQDRRGQALVEFAMVLMILLLIIVGTIDFARLFFTWASMANAAREGARFGTVHPTQWTSADAADPNNIEARARTLLAGLGAEAPGVEIDCYSAHGPSEGQGSSFCTPGNQVHVVVKLDFKAWTPLIPTMHLVARSTMVIE